MAAPPIAHPTGRGTPAKEIWHAEPARVAENLYFLGTRIHSAWAIVGSQGIIVIEALFDYAAKDEILDGLKKVGGDALRLWILTSHYRKPLTFTEETLEASKHGIERLRTAARTESDGGPDDGAIDLPGYRERFSAALDDDLNTPQALAVLFDLAKDVNRARDDGRGAQGARALLLELSDVLGLRLERAEESIEAAPFIELLVQIRSELRAAKQWELADRVRHGLSALRITLEDTPRGTTWKPD